MATPYITIDCKLFQMMPFIILVKVGKFHEPTANRFSTARQKPVGGTRCPLPSLIRVKMSFGLEIVDSFGLGMEKNSTFTSKQLKPLQPIFNSKSKNLSEPLKFLCMGSRFHVAEHRRI